MKRLATATVLALVLTSCTGGSPSGAATPQAAYDQAKAALDKTDWNGLIDLFAPSSVDQKLLAMTLLAAFSTIGDEAKAKGLEAIEKKHGVKDVKVDLTGGGSAIKAAAKERYAGVADKRALFVDLMTFVDRDGKAGSKMNMGETLFALKEEGGTATGKMKDKDGNEREIIFVRENGRWYVGK